MVTLLHELRRRGRSARFGVVSMCIGSGGRLGVCWLACRIGVGMCTVCYASCLLLLLLGCTAGGAAGCLQVVPALCTPFRLLRFAGMGAAAVFERGDGADALPRQPAATQQAGLSCDAAVQ